MHQKRKVVIGIVCKIIIGKIIGHLLSMKVPLSYRKLQWHYFFPPGSKIWCLPVSCLHAEALRQGGSGSQRHVPLFDTTHLANLSSRITIRTNLLRPYSRLLLQERTSRASSNQWKLVQMMMIHLISSSMVMKWVPQPGLQLQIQAPRSRNVWHHHGMGATESKARLELGVGTPTPPGSGTAGSLYCKLSPPCPLSLPRSVMADPANELLSLFEPAMRLD